MSHTTLSARRNQPVDPPSRESGMKLVERRFHQMSPDTHRFALAMLAAAVVFVSLCLGLGRLPLLQPDEGRNAEVAREMKASGAWLVPTYNGVDYLDKPAFYFKAVALSLTLFGDNETAARLPSALFGIALVAMVFAFCRRVYGSQRVAWIATIIVATTPLYLANSRIVIFDIALAFFVCGAIFAGHLAEQSEGRAQRNWYLTGAGAAGMATLVKGPVGFVVPILVLLVSQPLSGRRGVWKRLFAPLNILVFFAITLPWFVGLCMAKPDFFYYGIVGETFKRFTSAEAFRRDNPIYYFPVVVALAFLPWSLLLPEAVLTTWRSRWARHQADILCVGWCVIVLVFFSISQSKQAGYILSVPVACGILFARLIDSALANPAGQPARLLRRTTMAFTGICVAGLAVVAYAWFEPEMFVKMSRLSVGNAQSWRALAWPVALCLGVLAGFGAMALWRRSEWLSFLALAVACPICLVANYRTFDLAIENKSGRAVADAMPPLPAETEVVTLKCFPSGLPFYLRRTLTLVSDDGEELTSNYILYRFAKSAERPSNIVGVAELDGWLKSRKQPVFLIARQRNREWLETIAGAQGASIQPLTQRYCGSLLPAPGAP